MRTGGFPGSEAKFVKSHAFTLADVSVLFLGEASEAHKPWNRLYFNCPRWQLYLRVASIPFVGE